MFDRVSSSKARRCAAVIALVLSSCSRFGPVYPPRPAASTGSLIPDPAPSRVVSHLTVTSSGLRAALEDALPLTGDGTFPVLGKNVRYAWKRSQVTLAFDRGRIQVDVPIRVSIDLALGSIEVPINLHLWAEPIISSEYIVKLQSVEVKADSTDRRMRMADAVSDALSLISTEVSNKAKEFSYSLRPLLDQAYSKIADPMPFDVAEAHGCAELRPLEVQAGPTIMADGLEKDIAFILAPSVTIPCSAETEVSDAGAVVSARHLPVLSNVPMVPAGPFTVTVPVAASYDELTRATGGLFTDGKYFFSKDYPELFLEKPEVYASQDRLILKLHISGAVHKLGMDFDMNGDLFLTGHPTVVDNEVTLPDLEPTIETKNLLLSIKAMSDGDKIRDDARAAMRINLSERLTPVRKKLSSDLKLGDHKACFRGDVDKIEVTGVYIHQTHLRLYVAVTARARAAMPCPD